MIKEEPVNHVRELAAEYMLDLLPQESKVGVARHFAACDECRLALSEEQKIALLVRDTIKVAARANQNRHKGATMVLPSNRQVGFHLATRWRTQLAVAFLVLFVLFAGVLFELNRQQNNAPVILPTTYVTTIVQTETPTATLASAPERETGNQQLLPTPEKDLQRQITGPAIVPVPAAPFIH